MIKNSFTRISLSLIVSSLLIISQAVALPGDPVGRENWLAQGDAVKMGATYILTPDEFNKQGHAVAPGMLCSKEFLVTFELNVGEHISYFGGSGVYFYVLDEQSQPLYQVHLDSYFDVDLDQRYETDGNHVSVEALGAYYDLYGNPPTVGNTTFGSVASGIMPFVMEGTGFFAGRIHVKGKNLTATFSDGTRGLELKATVPYAAGQLILPGFKGITKSNSRNEHAVRNIDFKIVDNSDCQDYVPPLTTDQVREVITASCGDVGSCPEQETYLECVSGVANDLLLTEQIDQNTLELLYVEAQLGLSFCQGYQECVVEIDPDGLREDSYQLGYDAGQTAGYQEGYTTGEQTGYQGGMTAGREQGYSDGYTAGKLDGHEEGYADGYEAGLAEAPVCSQYMSFATAQAHVAKLCPCNGKRNFGQYVSCSALQIHKLWKEKKIDNIIRGKLLLSTLRADCR